MNKKNPEAKPSEPVMKRGERNLQFYKKIVIVLFDKRGNNEKQKKESANHSCPPHEPVPDKNSHRCHIFSF
jgi:hypothetical protein